MNLYNSKTSFEIVALPTQKVISNCTSILFKNQSTYSFDSNGNPTGWVMIINNAIRLLPGENISIGQSTGFVDTTMYTVAFSNDLGGVGNKAGLIARVNTEPKNCECIKK